MPTPREPCQKRRYFGMQVSLTTKLQLFPIQGPIDFFTGVLSFGMAYQKHCKIFQRDRTGPERRILHEWDPYRSRGFCVRQDARKELLTGYHIIKELPVYSRLKSHPPTMNSCMIFPNGT